MSTKSPSRCTLFSEIGNATKMRRAGQLMTGKRYEALVINVVVFVGAVKQPVWGPRDPTDG